MTIEDKLDQKDLALLVKAIAAGKDPREVLILAAYLGAEAAGKTGEDIDLDDPSYVPSTKVAGAMDSALRRFRVNEKTKAQEQSEAFRKRHGLPARARVV